MEWTADKQENGSKITYIVGMWRVGLQLQDLRPALFF